MIEILEYKLKHIMTNNPMINKIIYFQFKKISIIKKITY